MPLCVGKIDDKYRVIECKTGDIAKNAGGTALDGGGFKTHDQAQKQASAVNIAQARGRGAKIPFKKK